MNRLKLVIKTWIVWKKSIELTVEIYRLYAAVSCRGEIWDYLADAAGSNERIASAIEIPNGDISDSGTAVGDRTKHEQIDGGVPY